MAVDMRSLSREARFAKRVEVIESRRAGRSYVQIAFQLGLSRTGVFDICKRHAANGSSALRDAPGGRRPGGGRTLSPATELQLRREIVDSTPDELAMPEWLWDRVAVARLIEQRLAIVLPPRTLALYLERWGFSARRPQAQVAATQSVLLPAWLTDRYPLLLARSRTEGGEISWAGRHPLPPETTRRAEKTDAASTSAPHARSEPRALSMISALSNKGQLRWTTFRAPLDAETLLAFLRRLIRGAGKKSFLLLDDLRVADDGGLLRWLGEHEDQIEAFHLPPRPRHASA